jgi:hypothetical protein
MPRRMLSTLACTMIHAGGNQTEAISSPYYRWSLMRQQSGSEWLNDSPLSTYEPIFMETLLLCNNKQANLDNSIKRYLSESACCYHYGNDSSIVRDIVPDIANLSRCEWPRKYHGPVCFCMAAVLKTSCQGNPPHQCMSRIYASHPLAHSKRVEPRSGLIQFAHLVTATM